MARRKEPKLKKPDLIKKVVELYAEGKSQHEIIKWLLTEGGIEIAWCYVILREAKPLVVETLKDIAKSRLEITINELEKMKEEAKGDKKLILDIQKEINKISGLYADKVDITTGGKELNEVKIIFVNGDKGDSGS
jgi:hypothetical protein